MVIGEKKKKKKKANKNFFEEIPKAKSVFISLSSSCILFFFLPFVFDNCFILMMTIPHLLCKYNN
jgi:hypothetical protein